MSLQNSIISLPLLKRRENSHHILYNVCICTMYVPENFTMDNQFANLRKTKNPNPHKVRIRNLPVSESVSGSVNLWFAKARLVEVCCLHRKVMWQGKPLQSCLLQF